jgi:hypothetical protein
MQHHPITLAGYRFESAFLRSIVRWDVSPWYRQDQLRAAAGYVIGWGC